MASAKGVCLGGNHNKVSQIFHSEKEGRQWANDILLAVMRKSYDEQMKGVFISPKEIDIEFHQVDPYHPYDHYSSSLLQEPEKEGIGIITIFPSCFGTYAVCGDMCDSEHCPQYSGNCMRETEKIRRKRTRKSQEEEKKKPDCFGNYSFQTCPVVNNSLKEGFCIRCRYAASCIEEKSDPEIERTFFG